MNVEIISRNLQMDIYGFGDVDLSNDYRSTALYLSGKTWSVIKANGLKNNGINVWVYDSGERVFTGVQLEAAADFQKYGLQKKTIQLEKYAWYKHVGPYNLIRQVAREMIEQLTSEGIEVSLPYIEIYGHWTGDENKAEAELIMSVL